MRDKKRIPILLKELEKLWNKYPDFRFGQLIVNIFSTQDEYKDAFFPEDDKWLEWIKRDKF
jgi:hypothetical protein